MQLTKDGEGILLGTYEYDPFLRPREWAEIENKVKAEYPGTDLIFYDVAGRYKALASIGGALEPFELATELIGQGIVCMGSNRKVNLMTQADLERVIELYALRSK